MRIVIAILAAAVGLFGSVDAADQVRPVIRIAPDYPENALNKEVAGKVSALLVVDEWGAVTAVEITSESPVAFGFADAAREAFLQWKYPRDVPGKYKATFTFAAAPLELTAEEAALPFAAPPISRPTSHYPDKAIDAGVAGDVDMVATIDQSGKVASVRIRRESPPGFDLAASAKEFMSNCRFSPGARAIYAFTIKYRLEPEGDTPEIALPAGELPLAPEPRRAGTLTYPYKARQAGVEGVVELAIQIDKRGMISHAALLSEKPSDYSFAESAYKSLSAWRFGDAKPGTYKLVVTFKLDD